MLRKGIDCIGVCLVYFCHDGNGNLLFMKRSQNARDEQGTWDVGGGALELFNTVEERLKLEIQEEYMTDVLEYEFLGYRDVHRVLDNGQETHWVALDFLVRVEPGMVQIGEPHKFDAMGWFTLASLPQPLHSQLPFQISLYEERLARALKQNI
ncbi:MAG: NUDIX domain-containing protein [Candidatus Abawacabacteria bacterium]|nr:NUDIX domain-containing protein [Candidatus Abawacabacteria bacterium]